MSAFSPETFAKIKRIAIIALASDDRLVESLVLKGGNAIDFLSKEKNCNLSRASFDLDFSLDEENADVTGLSGRIQATLEQTFKERGYQIHDYRFQPRPKKIAAQLSDFWGGYLVEFKLKQGTAEMQMHPNRSTVFSIDISRYEHTAGKQAEDIEGYKIYVYSPAMIVFEKLRALCQQLPDYGAVINKDKFTPRARDYYDIMTILETHQIDVYSEESLTLLAAIFSAKKVPLSFIQKLPVRLDFHREDWQNVRDTTMEKDLKELDYYAEKVHTLFGNIKFPPDNAASRI